MGISFIFIEEINSQVVVIGSNMVVCQVSLTSCSTTIPYVIVVSLYTYMYVCTYPLDNLHIITCSICIYIT